MSYNILGINPFHNSSVCVLSDGEIVYFLEEERLSKFKHDANPFKTISDVLSKFRINEVVIAGMNHQKPTLNFTREDPFICFIRKHVSNLKFYDVSHIHHQAHTIHSFYNSGFNEAIGFVFDVGGSRKTKILNKQSKVEYIEQNSVFYLDKNTPLKILSSEGLPNIKIPPNTLGVTHANIYGYFTQKLGFGLGGEGKLMGLSSYGKSNPNIPPLFKDFRTNPNLIWFDSIIMPWERIREDIFSTKKSYNWHNKNSQNYKFEKDLAWRIQNDTQEVVKKYIIKHTNKTGVKNIVCAGGYFLNCVANYYLTKELPDINFYFEPIAHDGGTAIGAAYIRWKELNSNFKPKKQKTLYYGPKYSKEQLLEGIKKYV